MSLLKGDLVFIRLTYLYVLTKGVWGLLRISKTYLEHVATEM